MNAAFKTNRLLTELKEQKGEPVKNPSNPSPILLAGLLINSVLLIASDISAYIKIPLQILAIILMVYGVVKTFSQKEV